MRHKFDPLNLLHTPHLRHFLQISTYFNLLPQPSHTHQLFQVIFRPPYLLDPPTIREGRVIDALQRIVLGIKMNSSEQKENPCKLYHRLGKHIFTRSRSLQCRIQISAKQQLSHLFVSSLSGLELSWDDCRKIFLVRIPRSQTPISL